MSLRVICINTGDKYGDIYVQRLANMVHRHLPVDHSFVCYTDRRRDLTPEIEQRSTEGWNVDGWFGKLKFFDRTVLDEEFLFLDLALVVKSSMQPMVDFAASTPAALIGMRDWNYDCFGSMVMWIRPDEATQRIWDAYVVGKRYPTKTAVDGDQDFIDAAIADFRLESSVGYFPQEWFASFKGLRRLRDRDPEAAKDALAKAMFVKYHGPPKMHHVLDPITHARILLKQKPLRFFRYWGFLRSELRDWWR